MICCFTLYSVALSLRAAPEAPASSSALAANTTVVLRAPGRAYHNTFVTLTTASRLRAPGRAELVSEGGSERLPCQVDRLGRGSRLTVLVRDLPQGAERTYHFAPAEGPAAPGVAVRSDSGSVDIDVDGALFTRYDTLTGPNKPYFFPIRTPDGKLFVRGWPVDPQPGETHDHPHHRGLWFTHGAVNGVDYWGEEKGAGRTINVGINGLVSGPLAGGFTARTEWRDPTGKLVATDVRRVEVLDLPQGGRLLDFTVTVTATDAPLLFGDSKEGMFGLRVPDTMALTHHDGAHILTSAGEHDATAWGKPAEWVDFDGPIGGETYGVAIFDDAHNLRHPEPWHARDYGLFAANPFALHDFKLSVDPHAGDFTVPAHGSVTFRYRVYFHRGDAAEADVAGQYAAFADPPVLEIRGGQ